MDAIRDKSRFQAVKFLMGIEGSMLIIESWNSVNWSTVGPARVVDLERQLQPPEPVKPSNVIRFPVR